MGQNQFKEGPGEVGNSDRSAKSSMAKLSMCPLTSKSMCCRRSIYLKEIINDSEWKKVTLDKLNILITYNWSQILIKCLEEHKDDHIDAGYQNEVRKAAASCENDILHYTATSPLRPSKKDQLSFLSQENHLKTENNQDFELISPPRLESKSVINLNTEEAEPSIKSLSESLCMLDDRYLCLNGQDDWLEKSFEVSSQTDLQIAKNRPGEVRFSNFISAQKATNKNMDLFCPLEREPSIIRVQSKSKLGDYSSPPSPFAGFKKEIDETSSNKKSFTYGNYKKKNEAAVRTRLETLDSRKNDKSKSIAKESMTEKDYYKALRSFKIITAIIETHMRQEQNIFHKLKEAFEEYFEQTYGVSPNGLFQAKEFALKASEELQQFIVVMHESVSLFYKLDNIKIAKKGGETLFTRDNFINFITSNVFTSRVHAVIFNLFQFLSLSVEETYSNTLKQRYNLGPQDFGVADDYCLNERTIKSLKEKYLLKTQNKNPQASVETLYFDAASPQNQEQELGPNDVEKKNSLEKNPYKNAIVTMKTLGQQTSPIRKVKIMMKVAEMVSSCIDAFYKDLEVQEIRKIDPEQTLAIFMYILAQSEVHDVTVHCRIIQYFVTKNVLKSVSGYYASMFEEAVNKICGMHIDEKSSDKSEGGRWQSSFKPTPN